MLTSFFTSQLFWLPVLGLLIGLLVTMFGGGGGIFYVPILTLLFHVPTQIAVATSLVSTIPTVLVGSIEHYRKGNINLKVGLIFGLAGLVGAFAGSYASNLVSSSILQKLFGVYALLLTIPMALTSKNRAKKAREPGTIEAGTALTRSQITLSVLFGVLSGVMSGLFGTSGTATIVAGLYILNLPVNIVIGTSILVVLFNVISGSIGHLAVGHIDLLLAALMASGAIIGAFIGPRILAKINLQTLEKVYGILFILLVIGFGLAMLLK